ncbi:MAG TPA: acyl-CoA dehydrogenase family protein [Thermoplasmata archaeon]|jgi:alkylation response protein AidB-like acyl-CoA dehydrogenase|nr:acyl-CoA dehydrogenase family protein [Thermoplasmata archaeon]
MVEFELSDEQKLIQKTAHDFAEKEMRPVALECDKLGKFPWDVVRKAHEIGLDTAFLPEEYGGGGVTSTLTHCVVNEELNWGCAGIATGLIGAGLAYLPIIHMGTDAQKSRFLPRFTGPEPKLGALCLTEPDAGSDVAGITTRAERKGDTWVLNGVKRFITNGGIAELHVVFATVDPSARHFGIRAFVVEKDTPGLRMGKLEDKMGVRASHTAEVILEDCTIPADNMLGDPDSPAFVGAMKALESSRPLVAAGAIGIARAAYEYSLEYARNRKAFGKPIATNQAIRFMFADMKTKIEAARLLTWRAAWMHDQGMPMNKEASYAKLFAADMAMEVTTDAVQIMGGTGYMKDEPVEKWMRDAKVFQIWEGTSQIQRLVISREEIGEL